MDIPTTYSIPLIRKGRWILKNTVSWPIAFLLLAGFMLFVNHIVGARIPVLAFLTGLSVLFALIVINSIALFVSLRTRLRSFSFTLSEQSLAVRQAVLWIDTLSAAAFQMFLPGLWRNLLELLRSGHVVTVSELSVLYGDIASVRLVRTLSDRLVGLAKVVVVVRTGQRFQRFVVVPSEAIGVDMLGDNQPEKSVSARLVRFGQRVVVLPGLAPKDARALYSQLETLRKSAGPSVEDTAFTPAFRVSNVVGVLLVMFVVLFAAFLVVALINNR